MDIISSAFISTNIRAVASTLDTVLSEHDALIDALDSEKQDTITSSSKFTSFTPFFAVSLKACFTRDRKCKRS